MLLINILIIKFSITTITILWLPSGNQTWLARKTTISLDDFPAKLSMYRKFPILQNVPMTFLWFSHMSHTCPMVFPHVPIGFPLLIGNSPPFSSPGHFHLLELGNGRLLLPSLTDSSCESATSTDHHKTRGENHQQSQEIMVIHNWNIRTSCFWPMMFCW